MNIMKAIICEYKLGTIIDKIQEHLQESSIKGIRLVDTTDTQVVILVDDQPIDQSKANAWWEGFQAALGSYES